jgi:5'-nucleotidase
MYRLFAMLPAALALLLQVPSTAMAAGAAGDVPPAVRPVSPWPPPDTEVTWSRPQPSHGPTARLHLLGFNDFHGTLQAPTSSGRRAGGAAVLAAYLKAAEQRDPDHTLILHAGDQLGASPPITRLLGNEPAIQFLNLLANEHCRYGNARHFYDHPGSGADNCNVIGTLGNHEFDAGVEELRRLLDGGNARDGPYLESSFRGSRVPYVCANVRDRHTGQLLLPPYAVVDVGGVAVGVIGAVVRETSMLTPAWATGGLQFLDEAESINQAAAALEHQGVHTLVVIIHQGLEPLRRTENAVDADYDWQGPLRGIVARLDGDIDVVISGHTHQYSNVLLSKRDGQPVLITQAYADGVAYSDVELTVDRASGKVLRMSARVVPTWNDAGPGLHPDVGVAALTAAAAAAVAPRIAQVVATLPERFTRATTPAGESALGDLVADAQRAATHADIALMNPGGLRADLPAGSISRGDILTLHPFSNRLVSINMTVGQLRQLIEEQWPQTPDQMPRILKTSGFYYVWDATRPPGDRIVALCDEQHEPLAPDRTYRVTVNDFLLGGGDGFASLERFKDGEIGPVDSEALESYLQSHPASRPLLEGRMGRADLGAATSCSSPSTAAR